MTSKSKPTAKELKEYKEAFEIFDVDGDGRIGVADLDFLAHSVGKTLTDCETELMDMIEEFDTDGNGTIELSEFVTMMHQKKAKDVLSKVFRFYHDVVVSTPPTRNRQVPRADLILLLTFLAFNFSILMLSTPYMRVGLN